MSYVTGRLQNVPNVNDIQKQIDNLNDKAAELENKKQDNLVSGKNIKTVDGNSIVGSGNIPFKTLNGERLSGSGNIDIHNEPLTIKNGSTTVIYDGTEAAEIETSTIVVPTEEVPLDYDSQFTFYRDIEAHNEEQLTTPYFVGIEEPVTTYSINNQDIYGGSSITATNIKEVFSDTFDTIFTDNSTTISKRAVVYYKEAITEAPIELILQNNIHTSLITPEEAAEITGDEYNPEYSYYSTSTQLYILKPSCKIGDSISVFNSRAKGPRIVAKIYSDGQVYTKEANIAKNPAIQLGNKNDNVGIIKVRLNRGQKYLYLKAKLFKEHKNHIPGIIFITDNIKNLSKLDPETIPPAVYPANNPQFIVPTSAGIFITSTTEYEDIKVPVNSETQEIYIINGRNFGTGKSTTCDFKRDAAGNIIWTEDPETGIWSYELNREAPLYGGRILISEIGVQYEEELATKTLFTEEKFDIYKKAADYRFDNIYSNIHDISTEVSRVDAKVDSIDEKFTSKFNSFGDISGYTVDELPSNLGPDDLSKIFKYNNKYYDVHQQKLDNEETFEFTFDDANFKIFDITSNSDISTAVKNVYDTLERYKLSAFFGASKSETTSKSKLFSSAKDYNSALGYKYLKFGTADSSGTLVLDYRPNPTNKAVRTIYLKVLPQLKTKIAGLDPQGNTYYNLIGIHKTGINIYRNSKDNLLGSATISVDDFDPSQYNFPDDADRIIEENAK